MRYSLLLLVLPFLGCRTTPTPADAAPALSLEVDAGADVCDAETDADADAGEGGEDAALSCESSGGGSTP